MVTLAIKDVKNNCIILEKDFATYNEASDWVNQIVDAAPTRFNSDRFSYFISDNTKWWVKLYQWLCK